MRRTRSASRDRVLIFTCEHGGNGVPARYRSLFAGARDALESHRGWDPGALALARHLARAFDAPLAPATVSRLVCDLNRSAHHPRVLSEWTRALGKDERRALLARHWTPHRARVGDLVRACIEEHGRAVHVAVHSFTPTWDGRERAVDVALLYDPRRFGERALATRWLDALRERRADLRLRRNFPYRGDADGLTTTLRRAHPADEYVGIELEISQRFVTATPSEWRGLRRDVAASLRAATTAHEGGASPRRRKA